MSEAQYEEEVSNPYNARKPWHTPDVPRRGDADGLFYAEQDYKFAIIYQAMCKE